MLGYTRSTAVTIMLALGLLLGAAFAQAQIAATNKISDVRGTKHNLSAAVDGSSTPSGGTVPVRTVKASSETQVCVFCHTPHGATSGIVAPLWNRELSTAATYTTYTSTSIEASAAELSTGPGGSSKLCLSCHDGTMAIDKVNVLSGDRDVTIAMTGTSAGKMPITGETTGFTRNLGTNLSNDHPISFTYNSTIAGYDGELRSPAADNTIGGVVMNRVAGGVKPKMPLEAGQMQCATCHDPHLRDNTPGTTNTAGNGNAKFLRVNRFQVDQPAGGAFIQTNDTICLACHDKGGLAWAYSAHANKQVATQTYKSAAATTREFPLNALATNGPPVWQVACLNCHDTHTVQGAKRLLREGTDDTNSPKQGGNPALEETCYQCHSVSASSIVQTTTPLVNAVPDIKTDFTGANKHMPIATTNEVHEIGGVFNEGIDANCSKTAGKCGKDLLESRAKLGNTDFTGGTLTNRHAECSDCHNPHRVVKFRDFRGNTSLGNIATAPDAAGTHPHTDTATNHTNIASGVLRGSWGVQPSTYASESFHSLPTIFDVKRGDPGISNSALVSEKFVTREYQICLKCHSNYGYSDNNKYDGTGNRPLLGAPGTTSGTNGLTMYTNQAKEFQSPTAHQGEGINMGNAAGSADSTLASGRFNVGNHRSWHPVMLETNRTVAARNLGDSSGFRQPWSNQLGSNTMYCSDCHGSSTGDTTAIPAGGDNGSPWGPHGSSNNFVLKGVWGASMGATGRDSGVTANLLCFKCHDQANYSTRSDNGNKSAFRGGGKGNLHNFHVDKIGKLYCTWCHVAVPHGWKNRSLLVNLNDVGEEAGQGVGSSKEVATNGSSDVYSKEPYYLNAKLKIASFASSGSWSDSNCGSVNKSGTGLKTGIIDGSGGSTNKTDTGINWMKSTCSSPP